MRFIIMCVVLLLLVAEGFGQLVRKKDYDAAFALQIGGETGMLTSFHSPEVTLRPTAGLKMTFPFTRKWFLGSEVNYSELKYGISERIDGGMSVMGEAVNFRGNQRAEFDLKQIQVPLYLKYMLNCNKASVLFGFQGSYVFDSKLNVSLSGERDDPGETVPADINIDLSDTMGKWNVGVTIGYEHRIVRHLDVMCRVSVGVKEVVKNQSFGGDRLIPVQACITVSYDMFRIGDCGCD